VPGIEPGPAQGFRHGTVTPSLCLEDNRIIFGPIEIGLTTRIPHRHKRLPRGVCDSLFTS